MFILLLLQESFQKQVRSVACSSSSLSYVSSPLRSTFAHMFTEPTITWNQLLSCVSSSPTLLVSLLVCFSPSFSLPLFFFFSLCFSLLLLWWPLLSIRFIFPHLLFPHFSSSLSLLLFFSSHLFSSIYSCYRKFARQPRPNCHVSIRHRHQRGIRRHPRDHPYQAIR